ncbi:MAG: aspartate aminotransferase family protein, partial [Hyphomicrobiaceae bacterium]
PRYMARGEGAYLVDIDGRRFLDLNGNFTTLIHGHAFPPVVEAVARQLYSGTSFSNPTLTEIDLAILVCGRVPRAETIRFVNTGSEAVLFAVKAARAYTGKPAIAKIEGAYHGCYDWAEVSQTSTPETWGPAEEPASTPYYRGMPPSVLNDVVTLRFNDTEGAKRLIARHAHRLAAVLLDPMPSRAGLIPPTQEFVAAINEACRSNSVLLICDEVLNLRQGYEGASARHGLNPDLFALGKIIGGGLPIGAIAGNREVMAVFDAGGKKPALPQGGTFSANPLSMVAGLAALQHLDRAAFARLEALGDRLRASLRRSITRHDAPFCVTGLASLFRIHPKRTTPIEFRDTITSAEQATVLRELARAFALAGIILPTAATACLSTPMTEADIDHVSATFDHFLAERGDLLDRLRS